MYRFFPFFLMVLLLNGCVQTIKKEDLQKLNGYWEITEVEFSNGQKKEYTISTTIDYIQVKDVSGFRKKVQPQFSGPYQTSDDAKPIEIVEKDGQFLIIYGQGTAKWEETLLTLNENSFSVRNQDDTIYRYRRFEPLKLTP